MFKFKKEYKFDIAGISHRMGNFDKLNLKKDDYDVELIEEPTNKHDPNAVKVMVDGLHIGYVPAKKCLQVKKILHNYDISEMAFFHEEEDLEDDQTYYTNRIYIWYR